MRSKALVALTLWMLASAAASAAQQIEVMWLGHSTFRITSAAGKVIVIDPFLKRNPRTPSKYKDLAAVGKVDLILVTHGHQDHIGDLPELASRPARSLSRTTNWPASLVALGLLDGSKTISMNKGGTVTPIGAMIKIHMVPAEHSSSADLLFPQARVDGSALRRRGRRSRLCHRAGERLQDLLHRRHRCIRRHGIDQPLLQARPGVGVHRRALYDGPRTRRVRDARAGAAEASDSDALRDIAGHQSEPCRIQGCAGRCTSRCSR